MQCYIQRDGSRSKEVSVVAGQLGRERARVNEVNELKGGWGNLSFTVDLQE